jgi:alpha-1,2-mannosyltransferase
MTEAEAPPTRTDRLFRGVLIALVVLALVVIAGRDVMAGDLGLRLDSTVYRNAINDMLAGHSLYDYSLSWFDRQFPFNYPPFAALLLVPGAVLPVGWSQGLWMVVQILVAGAAVKVVITRAAPGRLLRDWRGLAIVLVATLVFLIGASVMQSLLLGQVSLLVGVAVLIDLLVVPPRWRGLLTGAAAAVKLLPLIYLPYLLITRQWRTAANTALGFVVATGLAWAVLPSDSLRYWTQVMFDTSRVGELGDLRNKSILGLMTHWELGGPAQRWVWLGLAAAVGCVGLWRAWRHHRAGQELAAVLVVGVVAGLISPISWPHHLALFALVPLYLLAVGGRLWTVVGSVMVLAFCYWSPAAIPVDRVPPWQQAAQYLMTVAMAVIAVLGLPAPRPSPEPSDVG